MLLRCWVQSEWLGTSAHEGVEWSGAELSRSRNNRARLCGRHWYQQARNRRQRPVWGCSMIRRFDGLAEYVDQLPLM